LVRAVGATVKSFEVVPSQRGRRLHPMQLAACPTLLEVFLRPPAELVLPDAPQDQSV
jgi:hypothetical protein